MPGIPTPVQQNPLWNPDDDLYQTASSEAQIKAPPLTAEEPNYTPYIAGGLAIVLLLLLLKK